MSIKQGIFHFRPTVSYRYDTIRYRGDPMEGMVYGDPSASIMLNGYDISQYVESVIWSRKYDGNILSISFFQLNLDNCHEIENGIFTINRDAVEMMKEFGEYFITLDSTRVVSSLESSLSSYKCKYEYGPVYYCDTHNIQAVQKTCKKIHDKGLIYWEYFLKDESDYKQQNEWRFLIHDIANEFPLADNGGVNIQTDLRSDIPLFKTEELVSLRIFES